MSLINEALKKAQGDRPSQQPGGPPHPGNGPPTGPHHTPANTGRRRSYLWGFVVAILVVGTFTTLLTAYFVKQFLSADEGDPPQASESVVQAPPVQPASEPVAVVQIAPAAAPAAEAATVSQPEPVAQAPATPQPSAEVAAPPPPAPPNPAVIARLMELEIRGIMSKGTRVLIFDQASGKTKAYATGESLEGQMGLVVEAISTSSIKFKDYAGQLHSKSF